MCSGRMQGLWAQSQGPSIAGGRSRSVLGNFSGTVQEAGYGTLEEVHTAGPAHSGHFRGRGDWAESGRCLTPTLSDFPANHTART